MRVWLRSLSFVRIRTIPERVRTRFSKHTDGLIRDPKSLARVLRQLYTNERLVYIESAEGKDITSDVAQGLMPPKFLKLKP